MAQLTADQVADVTLLLEQHPDWTTSAIREAAGLPRTALFSVKAVRRAAGIPEPPGQPGAKKRASRRTTVASETLDDGDGPVSEPSGPKRRGGQKKPESLLAPVLPRIAQSLVAGVQAATYSLSRGVAPMSRDEAIAVAVPAVRIVDRTAAKYIKRSGKVTPNQEDAGLIALTIVVWFAGWMVARWQGRTPQPRAASSASASAFTAPAEDDLFSGSEPRNAPSASSVSVPSSSQSASAASGPLASDESDLFAGSEPLAADAGAPPAVIPLGPAVTGPGRAGPSEAVWAAIMPTDLGEALVS